MIMINKFKARLFSISYKGHKSHTALFKERVDSYTIYSIKLYTSPNLTGTLKRGRDSRSVSFSRQLNSLDGKSHLKNVSRRRYDICVVRAINPPPDTHIPAHIPTHNLFGVYWSYNARVGVDQCTYTVTHYYTMPPDTASQIDCLRITVLSCLFAPMSLYPSIPE